MHALSTTTVLATTTIKILLQSPALSELERWRILYQTCGFRQTEVWNQYRAIAGFWDSTRQQMRQHGNEKRQYTDN